MTMDITDIGADFYLSLNEGAGEPRACWRKGRLRGPNRDDWMRSNRQLLDSLMGWVAKISITSCWPLGIRGSHCFLYLSGPHTFMVSIT
jgi:hypothetical protein